VPEGDTVWLTAARLNRALSGRPLTVSDFRVPQLATLDLRGVSVREVLARGKHVLIRLSDDRTVHSHLRLDGSWYLTRAGVRARRHPDHMVRVRIGNAEWLATGYRIHDLSVVPTSAEKELVGHLGPDLLGPDWNADEALRRLRANPEVGIGDALLDQRNLAGIGNMYKSEILFIEHVHPWTAVGEVRDLTAILTTARRLLLLNRDHPEQSTTGSTAPGRDHWVYGRAGQPCLRCRTPVRRREQGEPPYQRSTYWCPQCQPEQPAAKPAQRRPDGQEA
jgi:endonuclease-8